MKTNKRKILQIIVPTLIVLFIAGIWIYKNYDKTPSEPVVPTESDGEALTSPENEADFALNAETLDLEKLTAYGLPIIIDFGADWCGPCQNFAPILDAMHEEMLNKAIIKYVDTDKYGDIASKFPVQVIPTQVFINADGTPYVPSDNIDVDFIEYPKADSGETEFTVHQGGLTADQLRAILADMGVSG